MALTDDDLKTMILTEVNALTDATALTILDQYWQLHEDKALIKPILQYLYAKLSLIDYLIGQYRKKFRIKSGGDDFSLDQQFSHLMEMRRTVIGYINSVQGRRLSSQVPTSTLPDAYATRLAELNGEL